MEEEAQRKLLNQASRHVTAMLVRAVKRNVTGDTSPESDEEFLASARALLETGLAPESAVAVSVSTAAAYISSVLDAIGVDPVDQMERFELAMLPLD